VSNKSMCSNSSDSDSDPDYEHPLVSNDGGVDLMVVYDIMQLPQSRCLSRTASDTVKCHASMRQIAEIKKMAVSV